MKKETETQKIIITGGATRIGAAIAESLANDKNQITIHYNKSKKKAELATDPSKHDKLESGKSKVNEEMIKFLEDFIDEITSNFELPKEFVLPGQNRISALIDISRTVVRRAERMKVI